MGNMLPMVQLSLPPGDRSLADAVVEAVRAGITAGELLPDHSYSVYQLADLLGVSRSPVREALLRLAEAGLVRINRNRGFQVLTPQARDIEEIIEIRLALEPVAARHAAEHATETERAGIRLAFEDMEGGTGHEDRFWAADRALHDRLMRAGGNQRAAAIVERLRATTALLGTRTTTAGRTLPEIYAEHAPIVTAILARRGADAEVAMRHHLEHTGQLLVGALQPARSNTPASDAIEPVSQATHTFAPGPPPGAP